MFSSLKIRITLGVYVLLILSIPIGAYLASQSQTIKSSAIDNSPPKTITVATPSALPNEPTLSPIEELKLLSEDQTKTDTTEESSDPSFGTTFGPVLNFKIKLEGRPDNEQGAKLFIGIIEGSVTSNPRYLLSFTVDLPNSGEFSNLSLAGLTTNNQYTAIIKGPAQIATSSAFLMLPTATTLNNGQPVNTLSGDLNEDNTVNSTDFSLAKAALGTNSQSSNWNDNIDLNKDGVVNNLDISYVMKNFGAIGATGIWSSTPSSEATPSAILNDSPSIGSPENASPLNHPSGQNGYWLWVPGNP